MHGPLAYAFWHQPAGPTAGPTAGAAAGGARSGAGPGGYEAALGAFHRALAADPPPGWKGSWSWRLPAPPWWAGAPGTVYLDWYVVADLDGIGRLADAAVDPRRRRAHDAAAAQAGPGAGALYRLVDGDGHRPAGDAGTVGFADKALGVPWEDAAAQLGGRGSAVWMRQLTLGPGPEFAVIGPTGTGWPADGWAVTADLLPAEGPPGFHH